MVLTYSNERELGSTMPNFTLTDVVTEQPVTLTDVKSDQATVILFICNHCPFVKLIQDKIVEVANLYQGKGIGFIAISANDVNTHPDDAPDKMAALAKDLGYTFPYLYDENQSVAKAYNAACTPDIFIVDAELKLVYQGRFDDATPGNGVAPSGRDVAIALDHILAGEAITENQFPSMGCNIKWKN